MNSKHMTNEEKLDAIYEMTLENNEVLRTIRRQQYFSGIMRVMYWLVVLGFIGGAYYYVRPFIGVLLGNASKIEETLTQFNQLRNQLRNQLPEAKVVNQLLEGLQKSAASTGQ